MKIGIFSVYDSKAEAYLQPFYAANARVAQRSMQEATADPTHNFHKYAEDYTLFEIGTFEDSTGTISDHPANISLGNALNLNKPSNGEK